MVSTEGPFLKKKSPISPQTFRSLGPPPDPGWVAGCRTDPSLLSFKGRVRAGGVFASDGPSLGVRSQVIVPLLEHPSTRAYSQRHVLLDALEKTGVGPPTPLIPNTLSDPVRCSVDHATLFDLELLAGLFYSTLPYFVAPPPCESSCLGVFALAPALATKSPF